MGVNEKKNKSNCVYMFFVFFYIGLYVFGKLDN